MAQSGVHLYRRSAWGSASAGCREGVVARGGEPGPCSTDAALGAERLPAADQLGATVEFAAKAREGATAVDRVGESVGHGLVVEGSDEVGHVAPPVLRPIVGHPEPAVRVEVRSRRVLL